MHKRETMSARERLLKSLNHEEADRVPIDLGGFQTGIHKRAYAALLDHLGFRRVLEGENAGEIVTLDPVQQLAVPGEAVLERLHVDTRYIVAHGPDGFQGGIERSERNGRAWLDLKDEFGVVWSTAEDQQLYMDPFIHPLAQATIDDLDDYPWPRGADPSRFTGLRERALELRKETPYALCTGIGGVVYEYCWYLRGLERWMMDMLVAPEFCAAMLDRMADFWMGYYTEFMKEVGDLVDVVMVGDDLTGQKGPLFSPEFYRTVVKPRQKRVVQHIRSLTKARIWYHTCGNCNAYVWDLEDNGVDILNPVQISAADMNPDDLKTRYGRRVTFWGGGIDAQHVLPTATPEVVREHVRRNIRAFMPGGGYVFNNCHNIQPGVPPENIVALFDAAHEFGWYNES
jgi:uroporphyrinogen decarboxylase